MKVQVKDGPVIDVPSRQRKIVSQQISPVRPPRYIEEPLPHPDYTFHSFIGGWIAEPKGD